MNAKLLAAKKAISYVKDGMSVGLGTGSTAKEAIIELGKQVAQGLSIRALASSIASEELARSVGIPIATFLEVEKLDVYIDGADEADKNLNLIKGGGGALLREKILAYNSHAFIVIIDETKLVDQLGRFKLPVEVVPFGVNFTMKRLKMLGCSASIRQKNLVNYQTDNGNLIIDCDFGQIKNIENTSLLIDAIPGVVEHGLFSCAMVSKVIVGYENGTVKEFEKQ
ncbi:MAG: ribose-5-phosphate isomerase RpiA [Chitinophagaceae bacterium]|nr:MAG: ribose-5-phosphate isomerase RpiA [Chitinophagaceae bacterium]